MSMELIKKYFEKTSIRTNPSQLIKIKFFNNKHDALGRIFRSLILRFERDVSEADYEIETPNALVIGCMEIGQLYKFRNPVEVHARFLLRAEYRALFRKILMNVNETNFTNVYKAYFIDYPLNGKENLGVPTTKFYSPAGKYLLIPYHTGSVAAQVVDFDCLSGDMNQLKHEIEVDFNIGDEFVSEEKLFEIPNEQLFFLQ